MEKYIKASTALKFINGCLEHEDKITDTEKAVLTGVKTCIERIPAADVVEVQHAYKIDITTAEDFLSWFKCSACGYDGLLLEDEYCSRCGAKLDVPITNVETWAVIENEIDTSR